MIQSVQRFRSKHSLLLVCTGAFAWLWCVARACVQSIIVDEANTYLVFVEREAPSHWESAANNHVLNSALMRLSTSIFGASPLTLRLPALLGAALYIAAIYFLVRLISGRLVLQWSLFVCLVCNPFVMDYLVAARGYSLAIAFLALAWAIAGHHRALDPASRSASLRRAAALVSVSLALSFCANFSFGVVDAVSALLLSIWAVPGRQLAARWKALAAFAWPGLAVAGVLVGPVVLAWPHGQFTWGSRSLGRTLTSVLKGSLYEPNPYLLHPLFRQWFVTLGPYLYPGLGIFFVCCLAAVLRAGAAAREGASRGRAELAALSLAVLALTLAGHQFLYMAFRILLPMDRTALFIAPLGLIMAGAVAAIPLRSRMGRASSAGLAGMLALIACYSLGCLRLTYFKEWWWDADTKNVYAVLAYYNHVYDVTDVSTDWRYIASLNCYRELSGRETIREIGSGPPVPEGFPTGFPVYVLYYPMEQPILEREKLKVVYHGDFTGATVAIRPEVESAPPCPPPGRAQPVIR